MLTIEIQLKSTMTFSELNLLSDNLKNTGFNFEVHWKPNIIEICTIDNSENKVPLRNLLDVLSANKISYDDVNFNEDE